MEDSLFVSVFPSVVKSLWKLFMFGTSLRIIPDILNFVSPQIIGLVINFVHEQDEENWKGYFYAVLLSLNALVQALFINQSISYVLLCSCRVRTILTSAIYNKALRLSRASKTSKKQFHM